MKLLHGSSGKRWNSLMIFTSPLFPESAAASVLFSPLPAAAVVLSEEELPPPHAVRPQCHYCCKSKAYGLFQLFFHNDLLSVLSFRCLCCIDTTHNILVQSIPHCYMTCNCFFNVFVTFVDKVLTNQHFFEKK